MTNTSFSSGFSSGLGLGSVRVAQERNAIVRKQNEIAQQDALRKSIQDQFKSTLDTLKKQAQEVSASYLSASSPQKKQTILQTWDATIGKINESSDRTYDMAVQNNLIPAEQAEVMKRLVRMSSRLSDPTAETRLESEIETEQAIAEAEGVAPIRENEERMKHQLQMQRIREQGRQARETKKLPGTQRVIQESPDELANPAISQIYGMDSATVGELQEANIFIPEDKKVLRELVPARTSYNEVVANASRALNIIDRTPDVASLGEAAEFADKIRTVALDLANQLKITMDITPDSRGINDAVRELAGENRELGSIMLSMAYASAIAKGQTGTSLSDKDIVNEIKTIGGDARTQEGRRRALMGFMERVENSYRDRITSTLNKPPPKSPYTMSAPELVQIIQNRGGWDNLSTEDQAVIRARKEYLQGDVNE